VIKKGQKWNGKLGE